MGKGETESHPSNIPKVKALEEKHVFSTSLCD